MGVHLLMARNLTPFLKVVIGIEMHTRDRIASTVPAHWRRPRYMTLAKAVKAAANKQRMHVLMAIAEFA